MLAEFAKYGTYHGDEVLHLAVHGDLAYVVDNGALWASLMSGNTIPPDTMVRIAVRSVADEAGALAAYGEQRRPRESHRDWVPYEKLAYCLAVFGQMRKTEANRALVKAGVNDKRCAEAWRVYESIRNRGFAFYQSLKEVAEADLEVAVEAKVENTSLRVKVTWDLLTLGILWTASEVAQRRALDIIKRRVEQRRPCPCADLKAVLSPLLPAPTALPVMRSPRAVPR